MMMFESIFSSIQVVHLTLILIFVQSYLLWKLHKKSEFQTKTFKELQKEVEVLLLCERGMADRMKNQQQQMHGIVNRQDTLEITESSQVNYKQAIALMKKGATADELVEACDISRGELSLISHLQNSNNSFQSSVNS